MEEALRQRIKYVIEHGEVLPPVNPHERALRRLWLLMGVMLTLQAIDTITLLLR